MSETVPAGDFSPREWVLADGQGPVDVSGATVTRRVTGPKPAATVVADDVPVVVAGVGLVSYVPLPAEVVEGWFDHVFTAEWASETREFPSGGARALRVAAA